jgi:hypothetical protein
LTGFTIRTEHPRFPPIERDGDIIAGYYLFLISGSYWMTADLFKEQDSTKQAKPSLVMRVAAGLWFGAAFGILALSYFIYQLPSEVNLGVALRSTEVFYWIIAPAFVAGLTGSLVGADILPGYARLSALHAAGCGVIVGLASVSTFIGGQALEGTVNGALHGFKQFAWLVIYVGMYWGLTSTFPVIFVGAISGFILHFTAACFRRRA